jgi:hypothetical protein
MNLLTKIQMFLLIVDTRILRLNTDTPNGVADFVTRRLNGFSNLGKHNTACDSKQMQYPHEASTGTPGPVFGRRQKDLENGEETENDHLDS